MTQQELMTLLEVVRILERTKTDIKITKWFLSINSYLRNERPIDVIGINPEAVVNAALDEIAGIQHG